MDIFTKLYFWELHEQTPLNKSYQKMFIFQYPKNYFNFKTYHRYRKWIAVSIKLLYNGHSSTQFKYFPLEACYEWWSNPYVKFVAPFVQVFRKFRLVVSERQSHMIPVDQVVIPKEKWMI